MQLVDQTVNGGRRVLFGGLGQTRIECGGGGAGVTQQALDMAQAQALFKQMGGK